MGEFIALSGIVGAESSEVKMALSEYGRNSSGGFEPAEGTPGDSNIGLITRKGPNTTVMYPNGFCEWDDVSRFLSEKLSKPVFSLHIHDGDLWMFVLFRDGKEVGWFNPIPEYWEELSADARGKWRGDASLIASLIPSVSPDSISKYFVEWDLDNENSDKAYPDDEFVTGDRWQMCDFMNKIGLDYPMPSDGALHGETFRFWTKAFRLRKERELSSTPEPVKKWWKFW
jgi:hypothetical protein